MARSHYFPLKFPWGVLLLLILAFAPLRLSAEKVENLKPTDYVNDFAGVLSQNTIVGVDALCSAVYQQAHAQVVVVTVKTTEGDDVDDFTNRLEEKWKIGRKGSDRGVLILLATQDRKYRLEIGYGLEGILPDAKAGDIGRLMVPSLRQNDYDTAVRTVVSGVAQVIAADAGVDLRVRAQPPPEQMQQVHLSPLQTLIGGAVLLVVLFLLARSGLLWFLLGMFFGGGFRGGRGGGWGGGGGGWGGGGDGGGFGGGEGGSSGGGGASGSW